MAVSKQNKKFVSTIPVSEKIDRLNSLIVKRSVEKSVDYDSEINKLQSDIEYFYYGIHSHTNA